MRSKTYTAYLSEAPDTPKWAIAAASALDQRLDAIDDRLTVLEQRVWLILIAVAVFLKIPIPGT